MTEAAKWIMLANLADIGKIRYVCAGRCIKIFADNMDYISIAEFAKKNGVSERTVRNWPEIPGYLRDTCLTAQDNYAELLVYFGIKH